VALHLSYIIAGTSWLFNSHSPSSSRAIGTFLILFILGVIIPRVRSRSLDNREALLEFQVELRSDTFHATAIGFSEIKTHDSLHTKLCVLSTEPLLLPRKR